MSIRLHDDNLKTGLTFLKQVRCYTSIIYNEQRILSNNLFYKYVKMIDYAYETISRGGGELTSNVSVWKSYAKLIKVKLYMMRPGLVNFNISLSAMLERVRHRFETELGSENYLLGLTLLIWSDFADNNLRMNQSYQMTDKKITKGLQCMHKVFNDNSNRKFIRARLIRAHNCTKAQKYDQAIAICQDLENTMNLKYNDSHFLWGSLFHEMSVLYMHLNDEINTNRYKARLQNWKHLRISKLREDKDDVRMNWETKLKCWPKIRLLVTEKEFNAYVDTCLEWWCD